MSADLVEKIFSFGVSTYDGCRRQRRWIICVIIGGRKPYWTMVQSPIKHDARRRNSSSVRSTISPAQEAGTVYAPPGIFLVGGLELKSGVTLYLEAGCTLLGSTSIDDYQYHPGPPMEGDANGHHLLFAQKCENVTLCGPGTIDGQGLSYWQTEEQAPLRGLERCIFTGLRT